MRSVYDFTGESYRYYAKEKRNKNSLESKMAALCLNRWQGRRSLENAIAFMPYFVGLEAKKEGNSKITDEIIAERLAKAKKMVEPAYEAPSPYPYDNAGLKFELFRPNDDYTNSYDGCTWKAVIDHRITEDEQNEYDEELRIHFRDPYCDGRDCTGAPFTTWLRFFKCEDRTVVFHRICYDV
ncbi:hypothetical protein bpr_II029 (plasmid) [Butyrivibrio proteoclasticus B316]|uniref:Uncharacterized protein n=1 Tax=Butyrivibrio proteoclasticus (strain ATCC 51982 / DSM 14932 / B316) TaxID=515622 RepID=E0S3I7_BUTPB|nr:hypothetical protein [Butyrivibrio proteoclasticus]ADL35969.1 hypothetical protein bpr_II029 [Butyrivibrio proteoclasticus B316]